MRDLTQMTTGEVKILQRRTDGLIRDQEILMGRTPRGTKAYQAMAESRPGLLAFRHAVDNELDCRGA